MDSASARIASACSVIRPGRVSMLTLTVPVSSAVISSVCMPLARNTVATIMPTEASITMALCFKRTGMIFR